VDIPHVKSLSENFKRTGDFHNSRMIFKTKHTLRISLMKTNPERNPLQAAQCTYSIPCECARSYVGETGRPLAVRHRERRHNLQHDPLQKSKLTEHAYDEVHRVVSDEVKILKIESYSRYRKYEELSH
jgi:hypothetical protein